MVPVWLLADLFSSLRQRRRFSRLVREMRKQGKRARKAGQSLQESFLAMLYPVHPAVDAIVKATTAGSRQGTIKIFKGRSAGMSETLLEDAIVNGTAQRFAQCASKEVEGK